MLPVLHMESVQAREYFNPALLELGSPDQKAVDLSVFEEKGGQTPGTYRVDIYLNDNSVGVHSVEFRVMKDRAGNETLSPCLSVSDLEKWGVLVSKYPDLSSPGSDCADLQAVPQASSNFRFSQQRLLLNFPQSSVSNAVRGWVEPDLWDEGIPAFLLNYSASGANNYAANGQDTDSNSQYLNLRPGLNVGPWRLRNYTTWNRTSGQRDREATSKWDTVYTYAQRDIIPLRGQFTLGDSSTSSDVFDSLSFRGVQLASDDDMLPESLKGYAPVVRGIARTNAQVTIRQNGYIIYQTYVSPGSFEISDMYPTGGAGDLYVTIRESDGSEQQLVVPYASLPVLQREGRLKYSVTSGVYRTYSSGVDKTPLMQTTAIYGLPWGFTLYGGGQFSDHYQSLAVGQGKNLGDLGAVSVDVTQAWSRQKDEGKERGQSWRVRYSKNFVQTGTNFAIAGYRYATNGFWSMQEVLDTYSNDHIAMRERRRNRAELTMNQNLPQGWGNLALTAVREDYWNMDRRLESYSVSYNNSFNGISYGVSYTRNRNSTVNYSSGGSRSRTFDHDNLLSVNVSVPLNALFGSHPTYVNYTMNTSKKGNTTNSVNVGGTLLEGGNLSWNVQEGYGTQGEGNTGGINADWRATYGELAGGYSRDRYSQRLNYGIQGGLIVHENGITLGQPLGETVALVAAPGAKNVGVLNQIGVRTDARGYAIVPYASPYRRNDLTLDPLTFGDNTELVLTTQTVIPTRGAVARARYKANVGYRVLMTLARPGGQAIPFGAIVSGSGSEGAIVGNAGQVYVTGLAPQGQLQVKWGNTPDAQCKVRYSLPQNPEGIVNMNAQCD
ncbi:TPA: fimbrial biogenesis outer membrane usher protein [Citrobacter amalonaticus]|nr:fimbrial biogenesis outer membrane usher protein [Citrobacter amalonaticus]